MAGQANGQTGSGGNNKIVIILLGVIVVLLIAVIVAFALILTKKDSSESQQKRDTVENRNVVVTNDNVDDKIDEMLEKEYIEPGYYNARMSTNWHFSDGSAVSDDAFVENVEENTNDVYFDVFLEEDESTPIIQSPVIPRGEEYRGITLDTPLDKGEYKCVMVYHLVDENQETVSTLRVGFNIIVEN
ncbi:hypothetical protein [Butyrivibrio sp. MB2005]|uniref:hypothetical protein n=1 Tax=Butyrivibrio sp. MB2005 TaxID=1280678 RepID=UPI0004295071|nr:hypothetical protein [Butyrivibrio sp. MB2005]